MNRKTTKNKDIAIGYCRVSTDDQAEGGLSLDIQEKNCRVAAKKDGYDEIIIKRDEGKTGTKLLKRPAMRELLKLAEDKEIAVVYMPHSDRMARNVTEHALIRDVFRKNGVRLVYLNGQSSEEDAASIMADNMFAVVNQYHSDNTREKSVGATDEKAIAGYFPSHAPVGYLNAGNPNPNCEKVAQRILVPNPKTGHLITEAFQLYATARYNAYELNDMMYEKGLVTNRGKKLPPSLVYNFLKNRIYLGEIHWKNIHVKEGHHQPLIDEETFNGRQARQPLQAQEVFLAFRRIAFLPDTQPQVHS